MPIDIKTHLEVNSHQVADCLNIVSHLNSWLQRGEDTSLDKEVRTSMEATLIRACNRLDNILDEQKRWKLPDINAQDLAATHVLLINKLTDQKVFTGEFNKQLALGQVRSIVGEDTIDAQEVPPAPQTTRRKRKKK